MATLARMPGQFAAGTTLEYSKSLSDYPGSDGWSVKLFLAGVAAPISVDGAWNGSAWAFVIPATTTAPLVPGLYRWFERATKAGVVKDADAGQVTVSINVATAGAGALLSEDERQLTLINAAIEGRIPSGLESYQIAGRALSKIPLKDLYEVRDRIESRIRQMKNGGRPGRTHAIVFRRPT